MDNQETQEAGKPELVRIMNTELINDIKKRKQKTGVSIGKFFELAGIEKLKNDLLEEKRLRDEKRKAAKKQLAAD